MRALEHLKLKLGELGDMSFEILKLGDESFRKWS